MRSCPCDPGRPYADCCGRFHLGRDLPVTAEELMRSRYSAFAVGDASYLLRSWHPHTRPPRVDLDRSVRWTGLTILATSAGGEGHTAGTVRFRATHVGGELVEHSAFTRVDGAWVYSGPIDALP